MVGAADQTGPEGRGCHSFTAGSASDRAAAKARCRIRFSIRGARDPSAAKLFGSVGCPFGRAGDVAVPEPTGRAGRANARNHHRGARRIRHRCRPRGTKNNRSDERYRGKKCREKECFHTGSGVSKVVSKGWRRRLKPVFPIRRKHRTRPDTFAGCIDGFAACWSPPRTGDHPSGTDTFASLGDRHF